MTNGEQAEEYPEHMKLLARKEEHEAVVKFLNWIEMGEHNYMLGDTHGSRYLEDTSDANMSKVVAKYFDIDEAKFEQEKQAMLEAPLY